MKKAILPILLIAALVLVSGCTQGGQKPTTTPSPTQTATTTTSPTPTTTATCPPRILLKCDTGYLPGVETDKNGCEIDTCQPGKNTVEVTSSGFSPSNLKILSGEKVVFVNVDTSPHWPASVVHPTHKVYPGSDISKCSDPVEKTKIFDACKGLEKQESWSFILDEKGTWKYHDHLNPGSTGTVVVE